MRPPTARGGDETKERILDAALETLKRDGVVGTSARAIAATGGFAPGLIFYHFGTVSDALIAAVRRMSAQRVERYGSALDEVETLADLVGVARALHTEDMREGHVTVLTQMLAATAPDPRLGQELHRVFEPWIGLVEATLRRVLGDSPAAGLADPARLAHAVTSLFIGLELLAHLGGDFDRSVELFDTFEEMAELAGALLALLNPPG